MFKDGWIETDPPINLIGYVNGFRHRLYVAGELARGTLAVLQAKMKERYDRMSLALVTKFWLSVRW